MKKNLFEADEKHSVLITCIISGGIDTGISGEFTGEQINKIDDMLEEIMSWHRGQDVVLADKEVYEEKED